LTKLKNLISFVALVKFGFRLFSFEHAGFSMTRLFVALTLVAAALIGCGGGGGGGSAGKDFTVTVSGF
jgi:hypothetical protein